MKSVWFYISITISAVLAVFLVISFILGFNSGVKYIASKYGNKCYIVGQENGNIKYPIKFETLEDCLQFIEK